jgi:hypothetical protein
MAETVAVARDRRLEPVGWAVLVGSLAILFWSVPGLIVNPDFGVGDAASSERVLGVDMNGWHALSGFLVGIPGLLLATRPREAALFAVAAAGGLLATAAWAVFSTEVAGGLFQFPNNEADAALHVATSSIFVAGAVHWFVAARRAAR